LYYFLWSTIKVTHEGVLACSYCIYLHILEVKVTVKIHGEVTTQIGIIYRAQNEAYREVGA